MKYTRLLSLLVNIFYYISIIVAIIAPIAGVYVLTQIYGDGFKNEDKIYVGLGFLFIFKIVLQYLLYLIPLICLFYFRKILTLFINLEVFHIDVVEFFNKIGKYLVYFTFGKILISCIPLNYTYLIIQENDFTKHDINTYAFNLNFIWIAIGLFFIVLSEIFQKAKKLKQENDLTI